MRTSFRWTVERLRKARSTGSPPVASDARTRRRTSSARPFESGRSRRVRRCGRATAIAWLMFRARGNSSSGLAAKSFVRMSSSSIPAPSLVSHGEEILLVLQHGDERRLDVLDVELLRAERCQRLRPVDRLGETRRLLEIEGAELRDECGGLGGESFGHAGHPQLDDLDLPVERRMADPVKEAPSLQRVVQLAGAIRGEDHVWALLCCDRPELR